jgi:hypothetical protein
MELRMTDLYISYSTRERHWVSQLVSALESEGYSVWWEHVAVLGDDVRPDSQNALAAAQYVVAVWSPLAVDDYWVLQDAKRAQESMKLLSVCHKSAELPSAFYSSEVANLKHWKNGDARDPAYKNFADKLKTIIKPSQPSKSEQKQALKERKQRMKNEQSKRQIFVDLSEDRVIQLRN